jgi:DtxR family Mn-dependent transcriptional regulator
MSETTVFLLLVCAALLNALCFWPRLGLLAQWRRYRENRQRTLAEDALKQLHTTAWRHQTPTVQSLAGALRLSQRDAIQLIQQMETQGWLLAHAEGLFLTPTGERLAIEIIRAHRLWERYLADEAQMPLTNIHAEAEWREHNRSAGSLQALDAALGHPTLDPHGDPIPTAEGLLLDSTTKPLTDWALNIPACIAHIEDEPSIIYNQIVAEGLRPGQVIRVIDSGPQRLVISDGERVHTLAPLVAANIFIRADGAAQTAKTVSQLTTLQLGQRAIIHGLDESLQGFTRRRLLDLGLTPGTSITAEMRSLFSDPVAYRVRGTLIALRRDQAEKVSITYVD